MLSELLLRYPKLIGILADEEHTLVSAGDLLASRGVSERVTLVPGNFFDRVPPGADAYLLKNVLHDWDDDTCRRLLRVVRKASRHGARMLICENLLRTRADPLTSMADLQMMVACSNGRERTLEELKGLLPRRLPYARHFEFPTIAVVEGIASSDRRLPRRMAPRTTGGGSLLASSSRVSISRTITSAGGHPSFGRHGSGHAPTRRALPRAQREGPDRRGAPHRRVRGHANIGRRDLRPQRSGRDARVVRGGRYEHPGNGCATIRSFRSTCRSS